MWDYLESIGILEHGTDSQIKEAKKVYRKNYLLKYKQTQRANKPEFNISFSDKNGEYARVKTSAVKHNLTVTSFIKKAVLAYIENKYVVPNNDQISRLEQVLSECLNEVQKIVKTKERFLFDREDKYKAIEKRIEKLEAEIDGIFRHPPLANDCQI